MIKQEKSYVKVLMTNEQKYELKLRALQENKSVSSLVLEMLGLKEQTTIKEELNKELQEKQSTLSKNGSQMTADERKQLKDRIRYIKKKLQTL